MISICPTITAYDSHEYREQLQRILPFAARIHIDIMDGDFASPASVSLDQIYWPANITVDLHVMYKAPFDHLDTLISMSPQMIIVHAEANGDFMNFADKAHRYGKEVGLALLQSTEVEAIAPAISAVDHVLIFSGHLGHHGGIADLSLLEKAKQLRLLKPNLEIGWDGGVNDSNITQLIEGGIDVINVGGYVQKSDDPHAAYDKLKALAENEGSF